MIVIRGKAKSKVQKFFTREGISIDNVDVAVLKNEDTNRNSGIWVKLVKITIVLSIFASAIIIAISFGYLRVSGYAIDAKLTQTLLTMLLPIAIFGPLFFIPYTKINSKFEKRFIEAAKPQADPPRQKTAAEKEKEGDVFKNSLEEDIFQDSSNNPTYNSCMWNTFRDHPYINPYSFSRKK